MISMEHDRMTSDFEQNEGLVDLSLDAALELAELEQGERDDAPGLIRVVDELKSGRPVVEGTPVSMLSDVRGIAMVRRALASTNTQAGADRQALREAISSYLDRLVVHAVSRNAKGIEEAKRFCLALNQELLKRHHDRLTSRRWRQESAA
jgi:hypothetical protein